MGTEDDALARVAERNRLRAEAAARGRELPQRYRDDLAAQFAEGQAEAKAIVDTYLSPRSKSPQKIDHRALGATLTRLLDEHWPDSGVNGHYLADLLRGEDS